MKFTYITGHLSSKLLIAAGVCMGMVASSAPASADSFSVQYFQVAVSASSHSDFHSGNVSTGTTSTNYVSGSLVGGMPVYNPGHNNSGGTAVAPNDMTAGGVIQWWTPGATAGGVDTVVSTGSGSLDLSATATSMFPQNSGDTENGNSEFEETAILSGQFNLSAPGTVTFNVAADDDAFIFVDGTYVGGLGGIHALGGLTSFTSTSLSAGLHDVEIFYADQDEVDASLALTSSVPITSPTPEPGSLALLGTGVLGIAGTLRRRMMR